MSKAPTKSFNVHLVTIKRGSEEISAQATDFDLRILKRQHPPENVKVVEKDYDVIVVANDAALLHDQLCRKYDTKNVKIVERIFPSPEHLSEAFGLAVHYNHDAADAGPQKSVQRDHGRKERLAAAAAAGEADNKGPAKSSNPNKGKGEGKGDSKTDGKEADPAKLGDAAAPAEGDVKV